MATTYINAAGYEAALVQPVRVKWGGGGRNAGGTQIGRHAGCSAPPPPRAPTSAAPLPPHTHTHYVVNVWRGAGGGGEGGTGADGAF